MTTLEKLFAKVLRVPREMRFEELQRVLNNLGYVGHSGKGSHVVFRHERYPVVTVPLRSPVKRPYIRSVKMILEEHLNRGERKGEGQ